MSNNYPKVGLGVFIKKEDTFLMGLRHGAHGEGTWCFPGGHLEFGESWEDCARRETMEETGLEIDNVRQVGLTNDIFTEEEKHYITIYMMADYISGEPQLLEPHKCKEWRWFAWDQFPENTFLPTRNLRSQGFDPFKH